MAFPTKRIKDLESQVNKLKGQLAEANKRVDKHVPRNKIASYQLSEKQVKRALRTRGFMDHDANVREAIELLTNCRYDGYTKRLDDFVDVLLDNMLEGYHYSLEKQPQRAFVDALKGI